MKTIIRIPTVEYAYLEFSFEGTAEEAIAEHDRLLKIQRGGFGIEAREFNEALDLYLKYYPKKGQGSTEQYMQMSKEQQWMFQELKKHFDRITNKKK